MKNISPSLPARNGFGREQGGFAEKIKIRGRARCPIAPPDKVGTRGPRVRADGSASRPYQIDVSCLSGQGIETVKDAIKELVWSGEIKAEMLQVMINSRHQDALNRARAATLRTLDALRADATLELVAMDLRIAVNAVGEIVGKTATEDLLDSIFSQFVLENETENQRSQTRQIWRLRRDSETGETRLRKSLGANQTRAATLGNLSVGIRDFNYKAPEGWRTPKRFAWVVTIGISRQRLGLRRFPPLFISDNS